MKTLTELFKEERERFLGAASAAENAAQLIKAADGTLSRLLIRFGEQTEDEARRREAAALLEALRAGTGFFDVNGEAKLWESAGGSVGRDGRKKGGKRKGRAFGILLLLLGILLLGGAGAAVWFYYPEILADRRLLAILGGAAAAAPVLLVAGLLLAKRPAKEERERKIEVLPDAEKAARALENALIVADRQLALLAEEREAEERRRASAEGPLTKEETELYASLLEAKFSGDGEMAIDRLEDLSYLLHKKNVEIVPYSREAEKWFDLLPGQEAATLRPALTSGGKLLKKGLAVRQI